MQVYFALGWYLDLMEKDEEARNLLEQSLRVAAENGMKDKKAGAGIVRALGWIYQ